MWKSLLFLVVSGTSVLVWSFGYDQIVGKGQWYALNVLECEDSDKYVIKVDVSRKKINRTHDCFDVYTKLDREINITYGIEVVAYQEMEGGFKYHSTIADESFCNFVKKYTGSNWHDFLSLANIDPPDCPLPPGEIGVNKYVMNYKDLKDTGVYGKFDVYVYLNYAGEKVACVRMMVLFDKSDEDY